MDLPSLIRAELIFPDLPGSDRQTVLRAIAERIAAEGTVPDAEPLYHKLSEREELGSTAVGDAVAIPHCKMSHLRESLLAVGVSRVGVEFGATDEVPVRLFFALVSPVESPAEHLQALASISGWIKEEGNVDTLLGLSDRDAILRFLRAEESEGELEAEPAGPRPEST